LPNTLKSIADYAFEGTRQALGDTMWYLVISIPDSVESIGAHAFGGTKTEEKREVPTSSVDLAIGNPFISPPAIVKIGSENYIYITTTISQVSHAIEHKKLVTSNIIDNKTLNFEFEDQLSYFEVEIDESSDTKYLQPVFEGSNVPDNAYQYYCWYQYIDTNITKEVSAVMSNLDYVIRNYTTSGAAFFDNSFSA
jgi:hypothetical protein